MLLLDWSENGTGKAVEKQMWKGFFLLFYAGILISLLYTHLSFFLIYF